jgi:hypothetical protein
MKFERTYVMANGQYISTITGRRWPATPENLDALLKDNALVTGATANRPPEQSRSTTWRIAAEACDKNPTGPNPWTSALDIHRALIASNGFRDSRRTAELEGMEQQAKEFEDRKAKLLALPRPEAQPVPDAVRTAAETLRQNPGQLGERLASKIAARLDAKGDADDAAAESVAKETARTSAPEFVRALEVQRGEVFILERTVTPPEMLASAKKLLAGLESGTVSAQEYWGVFEPEQSRIKNEYVDGLAASKKAEIEKLRTDLRTIDDLTPPAEPPIPEASP